jgi:hypothetical protein
MGHKQQIGKSTQENQTSAISREKSDGHSFSDDQAIHSAALSKSMITGIRS